VVTAVALQVYVYVYLLYQFAELIHRIWRG